MPASASSTTRSGELMSFFMANPRYYAATRATPFRRRD
jgi:hypothetical protein